MNMDKIIHDIHKKAFGKKVAFVSGNFNTLHPGHLRLLKFAKESSDYLIVGVNENDTATTLIDEELRLEAICHSSYVDYCFILREKLEVFIQKLKPDLVVKGKEYENLINQEENAVSTYGGKLLFSSGDIGFSSLELLKKELTNINHFGIQKKDSYLNRNKIDSDDLIQIVEKFRSIKSVVIGDVIVDDYIICEPLGMSQEDPTIVVSPLTSNRYLGGAGIVAAHASGLGADVTFISIVGDDDTAEFVKSKLDTYEINSFLQVDEHRPTTLKQRYIASDKTLLRVNKLKQNSIDKAFQLNVMKFLEQKISEIQLLIFSDFSYGMLPLSIIQQIEDLCSKHSVMMVADSQSSSQTGDISKFTGMTLVTPTEREIRLALNDFESGLVVLSDKLMKKNLVENVITTLGKEGILIHTKNSKEWITDRIPAMNRFPKDVSGAGDSLLASTALSLSVTENDIWSSSYIGAIAAALQVGRVGNIPLNAVDIIQELRSI